VSALAERIIAAASTMAPMQIEGMRQALIAVNVSLPGNRDLWKAAAESFHAASNGSSVADMRRALAELPLESWRALDDCVVMLARGNVFDEHCDFLPEGGLQFALSWRTQQFIDAVQEYLPDGGRVLDVGCWQGTMGCELLQRGFSVGFTDLCEECEEEVGRRVAHLRAETGNCLGFFGGWAHEVLAKFPAGHFDLVTCQETLEHLPEAVLAKTCAEMWRVANRGVLIEVPGWDDGAVLHLRVFTVEALTALFPEASPTVLRGPGAMTYTTVLFEK